MSSNTQLVGKIKDAQGLSGELYCLIFAKEASWLPKLKELALASSEETPKTNYKVLAARAHRDGLVLRLENVKDRTQAEKMAGQLIFIAPELLVAKKGEAIFLHEILNYAVLNNEQPIGPVIRFSSNGPQDLLVVQGADVVHEIPFVEAFIQKIDHDKKQIHMQLPEGLLELHTGN